MEPLKDQELLIEEIEEYYLTEKGKEHLEFYIKSFRYYDVHRSDTVLLAMSREEEE